jgi:hypothetical protein
MGVPVNIYRNTATVPSFYLSNYFMTLETFNNSQSHPHNVHLQLYGQGQLNLHTIAMKQHYYARVGAE